MGNEMRYSYITVLRIISCVAIVAAHSVCTPVIYNSDLYSVSELQLSVILTILFRNGVPIFVMISGALFLQPEKEISIKKLLGKNISRILYCILIFGFVFALIELVYTDGKMSYKHIWIASLNVLQNKTWGHMWYLYMLIGLYLITPMLKKIINNSTTIEMFYFITIIFIFDILISNVNNLFNISIGFYIPFGSLYLFYYILGYMIHNRIIKISNILAISGLIVYGICLISVSFIPKIINTQTVAFKGIADNSLISIIFPPCFYSLFLNNYNKENRKFYERISSLTFGIYILHPIFINFIYKFLKITPAKMNFILMYLMTFVLSFLGACISTFILRLIPFVKKKVL